MFTNKVKVTQFTFALLASLLSSQIALAEVSTTKVGAKVGLVDVDNLGSAFAVGGYSEISLSQDLSMRPSIDYWQKTKRSDMGMAAVEVKVSDLTFGGAIKYSFVLPGAKAKPYVLGGLALHRMSAEVTASSAMAANSDYTAETSETEMGFDFGGGVYLPLGDNVDLSGELLMRSVDSSDFLSITAGLAYKL